MTVDGLNYYIPRIDEQEGWGEYPRLYPNFTPGLKPNEERWVCDFKHEYNNYKCHLELRKFGQDENVHHSGDNPSSRWDVDERLYAKNKSKEVSRIVSIFKDYSQRGKYTHMFMNILTTNL